MSKVSYIDNKLFFENQEYKFEYPIYSMKKDKNNIYILLDIPVKQKYTFDDCHNVYAFSSNGKQLWQIGKRPIGDDDIYTLINIKSDVLYATDFSGRKYIVCKENGSLKKMEIVK